MRWAYLHPDLAADLATLTSWSDGTESATPRQIETMLEGTIATIIESFKTDIGLWS